MSVAEPPRHSLNAPGAGVGDRAPASDFGAPRDEDTEAYACPRCGADDLTRVRRRLIDRFLGLFADVKRFRCTHVECLWEGNLCRKRKPRARRFKVHP
jgi:hypothetical protein